MPKNKTPDTTEEEEYAEAADPAPAAPAPVRGPIHSYTPEEQRAKLEADEQECAEAAEPAPHVRR